MKKTVKMTAGLALVLCLTVVFLSAVCHAGLTCTQGEEFEWKLLQDKGDSSSTTYATATVTSGACPGVSVYVGTDGSSVILGGTPTTPGTYNIGVAITMGDGRSDSFFVELTVNPSSGQEKTEETEKTDAPFAVTKSPTGETVDEGGSAMFIAAADSYTGVEWRILTADKGSCWRNKAEITGRFPGMDVEIYRGDDGREYMVLYNIPSSVNGFCVEAKFTDASGKALFTEPAEITVISENPEPTPTPEPSPEPTPEITPEPTPEPTPLPAAPVQPDPAPAADSGNAQTEVVQPVKREKRDNTLLYASAAAGAVLIAGLTAVFVRIKIYAEDARENRRGRRR